MASSSGTSSVSVIPQKEKYDVFISFRGKDTRKTFTSHLHAALIRRKVDTYIDYRLEKGDEVGPALLEAIKKSKISVIVFSENYADSTWCLDELANIFHCRETLGQQVIPIFYEVEPSDVRYQKGSYATAFAKHEQMSAVKVPMWKEALEKIFDEDKTDKEVKRGEAIFDAANLSGFDSSSAFAKHEQRLTVEVPMWEEVLVKFSNLTLNDEDKTDEVKRGKALFDAANLSGFDSRTARNDSDLVEEVVSDVLAKLNRESSTDLTGLIGAEGRIKKILLELDMVPEDVRVRFLVLWGMGGVGKTTLADAVYHGLSSNFETHCFLGSVRERSGTDKGAFSRELYALRNELLGELLEDRSLIIRTQTIGAVEKERLRRTKVLVVLDDVNDSSQLTFLAEEVPFGPGSRIIITTRDMQPVKETLAGRDVKMHEVEKLNGVESLKLFYSNQSNAPTRWTENLELLECGRRVLDYADGIPLALNILRSLFLYWKGKPKQFWNKLKTYPSEKLLKVYRASYYGLEKNEKEIFLDIACFHKRETLCDAKKIMAACGLFPDNGIEILIDMSLISIRDDRIWMHDVIQEMGCEIVREECVEDPGKRSRVYSFKDVCHVLGRNKGTTAVKSISWKYGNVMLAGKAFTEMDNLRFLDFGSGHIKVDVNTDLERLPDALKCLIWHGYPFKSLPSTFSPENLVELHMPGSGLHKLWNQGQRRPKNLRGIDLSRSSYLTEVPDLSSCVYIERINLEGCDALTHIPSYFRNLTKLTYLNLRGCSKVRKLPELPRKMKFLYLDWSILEEVHSSIWSMENLPELNLEGYRGNIPNVTWNLRSVTSLVLTGTRVESVPSSIKNLCKVVSVELRACKSLVSLPTTICKLKSLERLDLYGCTELKIFPEIAEPMERLEFLCLQKTGIEELPPSIANLVGLKTLDLTWCDRLVLVPISGIYKLKHLEHFLLGYCRKLTNLPVSSTSLSLSSLISLDLYDCNLLEAIPEGLISSTSLQSLNLCGNRTVATIPETITFSGLTSLNIKNCKRLRSLPELPYHLKELIADGCTALEKVSRTAWKGVLLEELTYFKRHTFCGCLHLDDNARSNIMEDAQIRIMRSANYARSLIMENAEIRSTRTRSANYARSKKKELIADGCTALEEVSRTGWNKEGWPEDRDGYMKHTFCGYLNLDDKARSKIMEDARMRIMRSANLVSLSLDEKARSNITEDMGMRIMSANLDTLRQASAITMWPGNEIPRWFSCQTEGSIINIKLPMCSNALGIALCVVAPIHKASYLNISCKSIFTTRGGERPLVKTLSEEKFWVPAGENSDHILVWYNDYNRYKDKEVYWATEASFDFYIELDPFINNLSNIKHGHLIEVKRCGVSFVYAEGHDGLKFEVFHPPQGDDNL